MKKEAPGKAKGTTGSAKSKPVALVKSKVSKPDASSPDKVQVVHRISVPGSSSERKVASKGLGLPQYTYMKAPGVMYDFQVGDTVEVYCDPTRIANVCPWNAECVGWHVTKEGNRFAALEPISQGLTTLYGSVAADVARGLLLRMDHGSQYLSDHFVNQVRFWGIKPSFAFVAEPQTNGVVERFNRTLKEQAIYGTVFRLDEVRRAVGKFVEDYNAKWRVEKNRFVSPKEAREAWLAALSKDAA